MEKESKKMTILQMNDSHAYFDLHSEWFWEQDQFTYRKAGGYARIATLVKEIRQESNERLLFLDNGDTLNGTRPAFETEGQAVVPIVNALGIDAMAMHWEFGYGPKKLIETSEKLNFPLLANNVYNKDTDELLFPSTVVKIVGDLRVGIIGIASNIVDKTMPPHFSEGTYFTLGKEELPEIIRSLRSDKNVDIIVLLSHLGFPQDMKLLSEVEGIDVCLSGHTHNRIARPIKQGNTVVIQSGCHGSFLGKLKLEIMDGKIVDHEHELIEVSSEIKPDDEMEQIIQKVLSPFKEKLEVIVGKTDTALNRATMLESTMDNFLLESMLASSGAELAFSNGWRYGAPIEPGNVSLNDLYNIVPMDPPLLTVEITGKELIEMIEENLERSFSSNPYNQMGGFVKRALGFKAYIKIENPAGHRVQAMFVGNKKVDVGKVYSAVFITYQGVEKKYGRNRKELAIHAVQSMRNYLEINDPLKIELRETYTPV
ncbi:bifunctional metallophosphatase/5'-nucleotidase [Lacticigenium naphthae]|uniref:bifunctional metallophosphatase/5'-nucleotidase n=1 Tax=Lacticigenium naphthae TaxID=515351 RepID=UPI0003FC2942|nr:bifunctional metallophosphatase/5'-nucleotidase [Lacticigenium naphthae]